MQEESAAMQAGIQITHEQEKLVVDALMRYQPADTAQSSRGSVDKCGDSAAWGDGLRTEWVTHCLLNSNRRPPEHLVPHRLYVQAAPGEMRLATVMIAEV